MDINEIIERYNNNEIVETEIKQFNKIWKLSDISIKYLNIEINIKKIPEKLLILSNKNYQITGRIINAISESFKQPNKYVIYANNEDADIKIEDAIIIKNRIDIENTEYKYYVDMKDMTCYGTVSFFIELIKLQENKTIAKINAIAKSYNRNTYHDIVNSVDIDFTNIPNQNHELLHKNKTPIETAIDMYDKEEDMEIKSNLVIIIKHLSQFQYRRPPILYNKNNELDNILKSAKCVYKNDIISKSMDREDINGYIIQKLSDVDIIDYLSYIKYETDIDSILDRERKRKLLIKLTDAPKEYVYRNIIKNNLFDIFETIGYENKYEEKLFNICISDFNYDGILFLIKKNIDIANFEKPIYKSIIEAISKNKNVFIYKMEKLIALCDRYNIDILHDSIMQISKEYIDIACEMAINGFYKEIPDDFLHMLCKIKSNEIHNKIDIIIKRNKININYKNSKGETALIIAAKNRNKEIIDVLLGHKADDTQSDIYGNTVYHYICINRILLNPIKSSVNNYGFTPLELTRFKKYYSVK